MKLSFVLNESDYNPEELNTDAVLTFEDEVVQKGPPVTAMLIQNTNPAAVAPDTHRVIRGFQRDDLFLCVHEQFLTETAQLADVVLPATMFLEHDDIYQAGGHMHVQIHRAAVSYTHLTLPTKRIV